MKDATTRFWDNVGKKSGNGCWIWLGAKGERGYGQFWLDGKKVPAHRFSWRIANGEIPTGLDVLHECDYPPCVRPDHLYIGDASRNALDSYKRGRSVARPSYGERNGSSKLTETAVEKIKDIADSWQGSQRALGRVITSIYGISRQQMANILAGKYWRKNVAL